MKKLITFLLIICAFSSQAQVYQSQNSYGFQYRRLKIDSTLHIPTFCGIPTLRGSVVGNQSAIGFDSCNNKLYLYNPEDSTWKGISVGTTVTVVSFTKNAGRDSIILLLSDGTRYAVRDSTGGSAPTLQNTTDATLSAGDNPAQNLHTNNYFIDSVGIYRLKTTKGTVIEGGSSPYGNYASIGDVAVSGNGTQINVNDADSSINLYGRNLKMPLVKTVSAPTQLMLVTDSVTNKTYRRAIPTGGADSTTIYSDYPLRTAVISDTQHIQLRTDSMPKLTYATGVDTGSISGMDIPPAKWVLDRIAARDSIGGGGGLSPSDTAVMLSPYIRNLTVTTSGTIYPSSTNAMVSSQKLTLPLTLNNQSAYTLFGRGSGSGAPSFLSSIDSNWIPTLHSEGYYNTKYKPIGAASGSPAGINQQVQFNDGGSFGGANGLLWDKTTSSLGIGALGSGKALFVSGKVGFGVYDYSLSSYNLTIKDQNAGVYIWRNSDAAISDPFLALRAGTTTDANVANGGQIRGDASHQGIRVTDILSLTEIFRANTTEGIAIGAGSSPTAIFQITSTSKGVLIPRMTKTQRNAIASPAPGLMVIVTGETGGEYLSWYNSSTSGWVKVTSTAD